jgi:integrase
MREALRDGLDPADLLRKRDPASMTFKLYAVELIAAKGPHFKSEKHCKQWGATLEQYAYKVIGDKRVEAITLSDIEEILRPMWSTKTETAARLRARIEAVLDYAYVAEGIEKRNPASYRGNLEHRGFEKRRKIAPIEHHPAAPYSTVPDIMAELRGLTSNTALCLRYTILTWTRSTESRGMNWGEVDLKRALWSIPSHRMKASKPHEVPLCVEAVEILETMRERQHSNSDLVFPSANGKLLSDVGINNVLHGLPTVQALDNAAMTKLRANARTPAEQQLKARGATVHGFRSTARSWAAAKTNFEPFVLELALAHQNKDRVEAAYQRDAVLEKRATLMEAWGAYCRNSNVIAFARNAVS